MVGYVSAGCVSEIGLNFQTSRFFLWFGSTSGSLIFQLLQLSNANVQCPMSNVLCLPKIGWNFVLYTGERLLHTSKALLVATSIANLLCSCSLLCALNFDNFLSSCAHLCADVHISVHVKRWSVVGGNKRMGRQGSSEHATCFQLREPSQKENLSGRPVLFNERCGNMLWLVFA